MRAAYDSAVSLFWSAIGRPVAKGIRRSAEFAYKVTKRWRQEK